MKFSVSLNVLGILLAIVGVVTTRSSSWTFPVVEAKPLSTMDEKEEYAVNASSTSTSSPPQVCTYGYKIIQQVGKSKYDGLPLKILDQTSGNGLYVDFVVGNTWATDDDDSIDNIYVVSTSTLDDDNNDGKIEKTCYADSNVKTRTSIDSTLRAYCGRSGVAMVRLYASDSTTFQKEIGDDAEIPSVCFDAEEDELAVNSGNDNPGALEYIVFLPCAATCEETAVPDIDPFVIDLDADDGTPEVILLACPNVNENPVVISNWKNWDVAQIGIQNGQDSLCTLVEMSVMKQGAITEYSNLKPVGRSYNGNPWEIAPGDFSMQTQFECNGSTCEAALPKPSTGRSYVLKSYDYGHELTEDDRKARFLEMATFGPTKTDISTFTDPESWVTEQFQTPITSHRQFFRERATSWQPYTGAGYGLLHAGPCKSGGRYRGFAIWEKDYESYLEIQKSPFDPTKLILMVGGEIRTVVDGPLQYGTSKGIQGTVDLGNAGVIRSYLIKGTRPQDGVGNVFRLQGYGINQFKDIYFNGVWGNPPVQFDDVHAAQLPNYAPVVELPPGKYENVMTQYYYRDETDVIELISDISGPVSVCENGDPQGFTYPPKSTFAKTISSVDGSAQYWLYSPTFSLLNNDLNSPIIDGGKTAVDRTKNVPPEFITNVKKGTSPLMASCSNVPRTFLNEDSCRLSSVDNVCSYDPNAKDIDSSNGKVLVCGSPYEVANIHNVNSGTVRRGGFELVTGFNSTTSNSNTREQRRNVWSSIALSSPDQLTQKTAYALSQILAIQDDLGCKDCTENYLSYYDIFVRHSRGNYFDIMKEVTMHPLMSYMLTYINGQSTGYAYNKNDVLQQADENYAREIMQLFSIGIALQNDDGTLILDDDGNEIATYTNFEISEYAKVYVGYKEQQQRGNLERSTQNQVDPLQIDTKVKDFFPKLGLNSKYVGDGYPLCSNLPEQHFLKKGATYRILGAKSNPDVVFEPTAWSSGTPVKRLSLDFLSSKLAKILCNEDKVGVSGGCNPQNKVILTENLVCTGDECNIYEPQTIEVAEGLWYEYIRPPCVNQMFFNDAKSIYTIQYKDEFKQIQCGNPAILDASTFCKITTNDKGQRKELFGGERVPYNVANERCLAAEGLEFPASIPRQGSSCKNEAEGACDKYDTFYWLTAPCSVSVKVNSQGSIAIVHEPNVEGKTPADTFRYVASDRAVSFFRADWLSTDIEGFLSNFDTKCAAHGCSVDPDDENCLCEVLVEDNVAFQSDSKLISVDNLLSVATIGAFVPDGTSFVLTGTNGIKKTSGDYSLNTIFEVVDSIGRIHYRKNLISLAKFGDGSLSVRNPVSFWSLSGDSNRDAEYELNAALEHYFYHPNVPSFLGMRLAQRFGVSNPSPGYIKRIATAFKTGLYKTFGSNNYGCLEATIAAIVLDREVQDPILDADPIQGQLQGPFMRLIKTMRALDYETDPDNPLPRFNRDIQDTIGEEPHKIPTVFSFFKPEYIAPGRARAANMLAPEAQVLNGPTSISLSNGLISLLKYGSSSCYNSFFGTKQSTGQTSVDICAIGDDRSNFGNNKYLPSTYGIDDSSADDIINDLSTILTSGRLSPENKQIIKNAFEQTIAEGKGEYEAMINAQQLIVLSPEFHTNSLARKTNQPRELPGTPDPTGVPYKAIIHLMMAGGMDSFSVLVPKSCSGTNPEGQKVHDQYLDQRGSSLAIDDSTFTISPNTVQPCETFVINKDLPYVKELYDDGDLIFFANTGVVNENSMTRDNFDRLTKTRLFAHNSMQEETKKIDPFNSLPGSGILGRLKDLMKTKFNSVVNAIGIQGNSIILAGDPAKAVPTSIVGRDGPVPFGTRPKKGATSEQYFNLEEYVSELNSKQDAFSSIYSETWSDVFLKGIDESDKLAEDIEKDTIKLDDIIWQIVPEEDRVYRSFQTLSKLIQTRTDRNVDRDVLSLEIGGWDHHDATKASLAEKLPVLNRNLKRLCEQLKIDGLWNNATIVVASEFGRTMTPNSNLGTDHGWGGNYFVIGGGINGGRVLGKYPDDITEKSRLNASRNVRVRFIPTTGWDAIWNGIVEWFGDGFGGEDVVTDEDLDYVIPNRAASIRPVLNEGGPAEFQLYKKTDLYNLN
jgi:uncharacterized protein (DUF1501 family)/uncharacterized protein (DUF1800 family)